MKRILFTLSAFLISMLVFSQNPLLLKDVVPGNNSGTIQQIVKTSTYTFFNENDGGATADRSLYRTDGTSAGTIKLNLTYPGYASTKADKLTAFGNKIVFAGDNKANYGEIWSSDGTQAGTVAIERFLPINNLIPVVEINSMGNYAYYSVIDKSPVDGLNHAYLRRTDGTVAGTSLVYDFSAFAGIPQVVFLTPMNGILYFIVYDADGTGYDQLWRSDGTNAGTYLVYNFGAAQFVGSRLMIAGNNIYIMTGTPGVGNVLWKSDGTAAGTAPLKTIFSTMGGNYYPQYIAIGNNLVFAGLDGNGRELWVTDGTAAGTNMVANINPGAAHSNPANFTLLNNVLYFSAINASTGNELWKSDGTAAGTTIVKDINPGVANSNPSWFSLSANTILFNANNGSTGSELWITDGSTANTVQATDMNPGAGSAFPNLLTQGNPVYFAANNGVSGFEVFKYEINSDVLAGPHKFYVNDNSVTGDVLTLSVGNNSNNGSKAYPFATVTYALSKVQAGDTIYVDAGTYAEQITIDKGITIVGAGQNLTSIINPASALVYPPGPFTEYALVQTTQNIGDVHISNLQTTNNPANDGHSILLQTGGSVKNCRIIDGSLGIYVRVESATKTVVVENNFIQSSVFAVACQGPAVTATVLNNTLNLTNPAFSVGIWVGIDFGPVAKLTATGNAINNYVYRGIVGNSSNTVLSENSILGTGQYAIENTASPAVATCNWYGTTDPGTIASKMTGVINYTPWLTSGTDNSADNGFQPLPNFCIGGLKKLYVNDNSLSGDIYTTAVGNDNNSGASNSPFATIATALSKAIVGDTIIVDAGNYTEIVNINKNITIRGAGKGVTIINGPAGVVSPYPNTGETGIIQTLNGLTDVIIEKLTVDGTNSDEQHGIFIQGGGRVSDCELRYVNDGFYFQYISAQARTAIGNNNYVHHINYVGSLFAGNGLNATATNNVIDLNGALFGMGFIAGYGGVGNVASFTASNNSIINFNGFGMTIGSVQVAQVHNNSLTRITGNYISNAHTVNVDATCNWFGTSDAAVIIPNITGTVTYGPWLSNGTDNDIAFGFQPLPNVCNGRQNKFYVNDASQTGDVFTTAMGNNANSGVPSAPLATVNAAITKAQAGDTIYVDAGTYAEPNLTIGKSVTILGSNYLLSPNDATNALNANGARTTEAIISNTTWTIGASDIKVKGLTFDPQSKNALAQSNNTLDFDNIEISNNIFLVTSTTTPVNLLGKQQQLLATFNYSITNNRFIKSVAGNGSNITMAGVDGILISGNTFTTNNSIADWTQNAYFSSGSFRNNNFVISNNTSYRTRFTYQSLNAIKAQVINNKAYETVRFLIDFNGLNFPTEIDITDNVITISNSNGGPVISYSKSNGTDLSAPNIARIERNTISADATGWTNIPQTLIAPTLDNLSLNTQVYIRTNKLSVTGDFSSLTVPNTYVSAIRYLNNSRYTLVENNEMEFTAINFNPANKFGIGLVTSGLQPGTNFNFINNKFNGFPTSVGVQNSGAVNGYGGLPEGVVLNINYNSFTGDVMSINNGTSGQSANAGCNWYGSAAAQDFISKLTLPTVDIVPWLTSGTDNDVATGFQPMPNSCDGYPTLITLNSSTNVTCNGAANGAINVTTSYGKAPFTYTWTKEGDANFVSHDEDPTGLAPGTYTLSILDGNGSNIYITDPEADGPGVITVVITEPDVLTATAIGDNNICFNGTIGSASVTPAGGTAPYTYLWSNGGTTNEITNLAAGIYNVTVTDANSCTTTASYEVTQPSQVTATIANNSTACSNIATVSAGGGTPGYTYLWSNGSTSSTISSVPVGTYSVVVKDANGCTATASVNLTVAEAFNPSASVTNVTCFGANNGVITVTNANGTAPFMFSKDGGVTFVNGTLPFSFTGLAAGTYTIGVKDANGCTGFVDRTVTQPAQLTPTISSVVSSCFGQSTGAVNVTVTGGNPAYTYSWTRAGGGFSSSQLNISGVAAGNYTLTVTDKNGCTAVLPITVPSNNEIVVNAAITNVLCRNTATGAINLTVTGGTGAGFSYSWTGAVISSNEDLNNILAANNYNVRITDVGSGCFVDRSYQVTQPATLTLSIASSNNATTCASLGAITVTAGGGSGGYQYSINGSAYQSSNSFTGLYAGTYTITVRDANGCTATVSRTITDSGSDVYESNNGRTQSKPISIGTTINARLALAADVADWFVITTPTGGTSSTYSLVITHPTPGISYTFDLYPASPNNAVALIPAGVIGTTRKDYLLAPGTSYRIGVTTTTLSFICYSLSVNPVVPVTSRNSSASPVVSEVTQSPVIDVLKSTVYPNPHRGSFTLRIESPDEGIGTVEMYNANGQLLGERKVNLVKGKGNVVQYNNMNHAVLFYRVHIGKHIVNGKIIGAN